MAKVFNITVQVQIQQKDREGYIKKLDDLCNVIDAVCDGSPTVALQGQATVNGYWDSTEDYLNGKQCKDDDCWDE